MKNERIEMYEKAIQELHETKIESVRAEISKAKNEALGFAIFILTGLAVIAFLIY